VVARRRLRGSGPTPLWWLSAVSPLTVIIPVKGAVPTSPRPADNFWESALCYSCNGTPDVVEMLLTKECKLYNQVAICGGKQLKINVPMSFSEVAFDVGSNYF